MATDAKSSNVSNWVNLIWVIADPFDWNSDEIINRRGAEGNVETRFFVFETLFANSQIQCTVWDIIQPLLS